MAPLRTRPATLVAALAAAAGAALLVAGPAAATSPGANGAIAFVRAGDLWAINADGTGERPLTATPELEHAPAWSPDGATLAFARGPLFPDEAGAAADVWIAGADGAGARRVTSGPLPETEPSFAPDGRRLAVARRGGALGCESSDRIVVLDLATGAERLLAGGGAREPAWSPAGGRIAFAVDPGCNDPTELRLVPEGGGEAVAFPGASPLLQSTDADERPSWAPDGTQVALRSRREECVPVGEQLECRALGGVALRPADVAAPRQVLVPDALAPAFSPDGRALAYVRGGDLLVRDLATGLERRLTGGAADPAWQAIGPGTPAPAPAGVAGRSQSGSAPALSLRRARAAPRRRALALAGVRRVRLVAGLRPRLTWRARPGATAYRLALLRGARRVFTRVTARPQTPLPARLRPGRYRLVVWTGRGPAGARRFAARPLLAQPIVVRAA